MSDDKVYCGECRYNSIWHGLCRKNDFFTENYYEIVFKNEKQHSKNTNNDCPDFEKNPWWRWF